MKNVIKCTIDRIRRKPLLVKPVVRFSLTIDEALKLHKWLSNNNWTDYREDMWYKEGRNFPPEKFYSKKEMYELFINES